MNYQADQVLMASFESEGAYAGIPYRVLPDASIEALLPSGLVKFKNIDQFLASANGASTKANLTRPIVSVDASGERIANVPASAQQMDYYSLLVEAIKNTQQNSAQLRQLVYERARFNFKRDVLFGHSSLGLSDLMQYVNDFELAVARIEATADDDPQGSTYQKSDPQQVTDRFASTTGDGQSRIDRANAEEARTRANTAIQVLEPRYVSPPNPELYQVQRTDNFAYDPRASEFESNKRFANPLAKILAATMVLTGIVFILGTLWFLLKTAPEILAVNKASKVTVIQQPIPQSEPPKLPYPVPTSYGIYVLSDNKLTELQALAMNVPDPRVALSAEIKTPSTTTISDSNPSFILFRRDLVNSVPQKITLRVVARLARETKIVDGKAKSINIDDTWRIRNISRELRVSPIPGQREMVIAHLEDNDPLPAGRYELALNRIGYDFTVAGSIKAPAQCLERFELTTGPIYTECRPQ